MKLPKGVFIDGSQKPLADVLRERSQGFKGLIHVYKDGGSGEGFMLVEDGNVLASAYTMMGITFYQLNALERMMSLGDVSSEIYSYDDNDRKALLHSFPDSLITDGAEKPPEIKPQKVSPPTAPGRFDMLLSSIVSQEGVTAAALVADGFPVYQAGKHVDFEHVAVTTEDMIRAGARIASELQLGVTGQIILETSQNKVIIAQVEDMLLCVLARPEVSLGMVRLIIKNAQAG